MKKNKISLLLGLFFFSFVFFACSDDDKDDDGSDSKIIGKWEYVSQKYWTTVNGEMEGSEHIISDGENEYSYWEFYKDGTGQEEESGGPGDYNAWPFKWKINGDALTLTTDEGDEKFKITELTSESLITKSEEDEGEGRVWHSILTYKRKK